MGSQIFFNAPFNKFLSLNDKDNEAWLVMDMYGCNQFWMFEFKVRRCMRGRSHDWMEGPFAH
uniref:AtC3H23-like CCCH zinc finger domain-containing protein n=1 Tax=Physcomitrium patens TaxID=3218 RepID=A0A7I3ZEJ4_PHYPA